MNLEKVFLNVWVEVNSDAEARRVCLKASHDAPDDQSCNLDKSVF